jgi:hypothetical protein
MSKVWVSAEYVFNRTVDLLGGDQDISRVVPPRPVIFPSQDRPVYAKKRVTKATRKKRRRREKRDQVFEPMILWGPIERPDFVIDESELPY